ncbi:MAG: maleylacetate reductase [Alicyclobacillaceae bacterium]|nr:maleylacetate reductase [Alicyclobacillaceae bacterium]
MDTFKLEILPARVVFGAGVLQRAGEELDALGGRRAMVITTPRQVQLANTVAGFLGDRTACIHSRAVQHVPVETIHEGVARAREAGVDSLVPVGGGSAIGLAKMIALETGLPILAIPTTYSGSEMTPVWGKTENGVKTTGRDPVVKPKAVVYDVNLTLALPAGTSMVSGLNAMAHLVEGLYTENVNRFIFQMAEDGIRALATSLPRIAKNPADLEARSEALYGAWIGGMILGTVGMALHHKLCHVLGGTCNLPHAETHAVVLPYAVAYNAPKAEAAMRAIGRALGHPDASPADVPSLLYDFERALNIPASLKELGMQESDIDTVAELATKNPYYNPRVPERAEIRELLRLAYHGERPGVM